jgi:DNA-binding transcriptional LysR family regulator
MNRKQLETFETIVRLGSFAAAAAKLNATQSTVSARIQELEALGVQLFDRAQRKANLTTKGRELVSYAQTAIDLFSKIQHQVGNPQALAGIVRVGVAELVAVTRLPHGMTMRMPPDQSFLARAFIERTSSEICRRRAIASAV